MAYLFKKNFINLYLFKKSFYFKRLSSTETTFKDIDQELLKTIKKFVLDEILPNVSHFDQTGKYPWTIVKKLHSLGLMNTDTPKELGGLNLSLEFKTRIYQELAYADTGIGTSLMVNELAQIPLMQSGSKLLQEKYMKRMLSEPILAAYAVTEPEAGSDLANLKMKAIFTKDHYILNGTKAWITNAGLADWYFILARTDPDLRSSKAFTGFIVERNFNGLSVGKREQNIGQKCSDMRSLFLENVKVPIENIVGQVGEGFLLAMRAFDRTRPIVASLACGLAKRALNESINYATERKTFKKPISEYQGVSFKLAEMAMNLEAAQGLTLKSAQMIDTKNKSATHISACAKCFATDTAFQAATAAVQIFGANGLNVKYPVEKLLRDAKSLQIYGGTSEVQRIIIAKHVVSNYLK